jgi:hypothetical protein
MVEPDMQAVAPVGPPPAQDLERTVAAENGPQPEERSRRLVGHQETFWLIFVLATVGLLLVAVRPAKSESAAADQRAEQVRAAVADHERYLKELRRAREALERGDPSAWEAVCREYGLVRPGDLRIEGPTSPVSGGGK